MTCDADILIVGAGAAGLMTAIWAGRTDPARRIVVLDGARTLGAKILVSGGGRCNVTHDVVDEQAYAGSSRMTIRKVLRRFDVTQTIRFFEELGVTLKREETGKLFPVTDSARTVLDALLREAGRVGAQILHPRRVEEIERMDDEFEVRGDWGASTAKAVVLATGGKSLPKTGSDGHGYALARSLGHSVSKRAFPALVPLTVEAGHFIRELSGVTIEAELSVVNSKGKTIASFTDSMLLTHFGVSGPAVLDISRYFIDAQADDAGVAMTVNWLPGDRFESIDRALVEARSQGVIRFLRDRLLPERLARALCASADVEAGAKLGSLSREQRRALARALTEMRLPVTGDRGFAHAEVTAGGVPLREVDVKTMASRVCDGLHLVGEICDVDGRIGGYNFQWAWSSGYTAGMSVGRARLTR